jgi:hypothetical protein
MVGPDVPIIKVRSRVVTQRSEREDEMTRIPLQSLKPGTKLARSVLNKDGMVMVGEDTELTESLIEKMRDMGVPGVYVQGASRTLPPREQVLDDLNRRFEQVEGLPHMDVLKQLLTEHFEGLYRDHEFDNA